MVVKLKLSSEQTKEELYYHKLKDNLCKISMELYENDSWDGPFISRTLGTQGTKVNQAPILFNKLPKYAKTELKFYWASLLRDPRHWEGHKDRVSSIERRRLAMTWLNDCWDSISKYFNINYFSDIPHPEFNVQDYCMRVKKEHNPHLVDLFNTYLQGQKKGYQSQKQTYVSSGEIVGKAYLAFRLLVISNIHKQIIINREQFKPLHDRNIILINDIYSEVDTRFQGRQKNRDRYINFYLYPKWCRKALRVHVLEKVENQELAPSTLVTYVASYRNFVTFMYNKYELPKSSDISNFMIENEFLAWGNKKGLSGKNWFTNVVAFLKTASHEFPLEWPSLSVSARTTRKIVKSYYKNGLGRMGRYNELDKRVIEQKTLNLIANHIHESPSPIPLIFVIAVATGARAEDIHAMLFDCLTVDPDDNKFMLLKFWQNKVSKWNIKPLSISDEKHIKLINMIKEHQTELMKFHNGGTKYLFPSIVGGKECFLSHSWTREVIKKICVRHEIKGKDGKLYQFSWHQLRHLRGTSMAQDGHDVLAIMMELGHTSPDMATVYVNNRLQLRKKALMEKGSGAFVTIKGEVDEKIGDLLLRKEQMNATRVCGGACSLPSQIGTWCEHANACLNCKYFRADPKDLDYFKDEKSKIMLLVGEQENEYQEETTLGRTRMAEIVKARQGKNKETMNHLETIISTIETKGLYTGCVAKFSRSEELNA